jgi:hypothetical protein
VRRHRALVLPAGIGNENADFRHVKPVEQNAVPRCGRFSHYNRIQQDQPDESSHLFTSGGAGLRREYQPEVPEARTKHAETNASKSL